MDRYEQVAKDINASVDTAAIMAQIRELQAENAKLKAQSNGKLSLKVSEKGAISVYGMGKWPITLYRGQMERLLANADQVKAFIEANASALRVKGE